MAIDTAALAIGIARVKARMATLEQDLNEADAKLGDGDTGGMLARVVDRLAAVEIAPGGDVGETFATLARAAAGATGSSLGTLLATGLLTIAKQTRGEREVPWDRLGALLAAARDAMMARGGAKLGDKTVLDAIDGAARAAEGGGPGTPAERALAGAAAALESLRGEPCKIGRARMFAEKSIGSDDPGMLAFVRLAEAMARPEG